MIQIEIHKKNGESYRAAVPSLQSVQNLATICDITHITIYAITPREYNAYKLLFLSPKITISR
jgi:hypothetical protein